MQVEQIDVFTLRIPHHYRVGGHAETPGRLPGTDYYVEPQWVHAYSSVTEACLVKVTGDDGTFGWGEVQAPLTPQTACALITTLLAPALLEQDPLATAMLYDRLYHLMLARGHVGSFLVDAIAGLDMALWFFNMWGTGQTRDAKNNYNWSKAAEQSRDYPMISVFDDYVARLAKDPVWKGRSLGEATVLSSYVPTTARRTARTVMSVISTVIRS